MMLSDGNPFSQILSLPISIREQKPRRQGLTMVIDKGLGLESLNDLLQVCAPYMDILKVGFGSACLYSTPVLRQKLALCRLYSVLTCAGGTLGEIALLQGKFEPYAARCRDLGFSAMEISDGTIDLPQGARKAAIATAKRHMPLVITEVGKKLESGFDVAHTAAMILDDIAAGADYVIVEGRESGENVGLFGDEGCIHEADLAALCDALPGNAQAALLFEAPKKSQQVAFITKFGSDVNLGNIAPSEALALECLRRGLRSDTLPVTSILPDANS